MEDNDLPFDDISELKESLQRDYERLFNDSADNDLSVDEKTSDKENTDILGNTVGPKDDTILSTLANANKENIIELDDSESSSCYMLDDDVSLSTCLTKNTANIPKPKRHNTPKKSRYNLRRRSHCETETVLVGDAEDDETVASTGEYSEVQRKRTRTRARLQKKVVNRTASDNIPVSAIIDIDNYDEDACSVVDTSKFPIRNTFADVDIVNEEMNVKINWLYEGAKSFKLKKYETFQKIFLKLAEEKKVDEERIVLWKDDVKVMPSDTPDSINLNILDILSGYTLTKPVAAMNNANQKTKHANALEVKVITDSKKNKEMLFSINKNQKMLVLFIKIAEHLNNNIRDLELWFDGEKVSENDTTVDLDLEGGECFELKIRT